MLECGPSAPRVAASRQDRKVSPGERKRVPAGGRHWPAGAARLASGGQVLAIGALDRLGLSKRGSAGEGARLIAMLGGCTICHIAVLPSSATLMSRPSRSAA
jgi:hypothetical protein